ncbi:MAG: polysaccharide biosynthesis tyrosine autokinase [Verrucomicrobia bacterium]|nr:polysaccharide biosynthesis tyrosine autokinase [Verrucomicrobiota bacterium]MCF7708324.1 polysaccharide biosynthesis tyrosine autokinase [Verrucomicrobiota bacterium]
MEDQNQQFIETEESADQSINLRHYWHIIMERRWIVLSAFLTILFLSGIYLFKAPRIYEAKAQLQIDSEAEKVLNIEDAFAVNSREQDYLQTQYKKLKSRRILKSVVEDLNLQSTEKYKNSQDPVGALSKDITIDPIRLSRLVDIKVEHTDPVMATKIANTLATNFISDNLDRKMQASLNASKFLKEEEKIMKQEVEEALQKLEKYKQTNNITSFEDRENIILQGLQTAQQRLTSTQAKAAIAQRQYEEVKQLLDADVNIDSIPQIASNALIQELKAELIIQQSQLADLLKRYKEQYPEVIRTREKIDSLKESIQEQSQNIFESLKNEATIAQGETESIQQLVDQLKKEQLNLSELRVQYEILQREATQKRNLYNKVIERRQELELTAKSKTNNIQLVDDAIVPLNPVKPRMLIILFLGVFGGIAAGIGLAFFVNFLDDSIKSQDDVEVYLKLPFLGYVPNIKSNSVIERDLQVQAQPQSAASEAFRSIRAAITLMPSSSKMKVMAVTGTIPGEGKSLISSNLAIVSAHAGMKTLLIDADLRRPSVHKAFQLHSPEGITAYLSDTDRPLDGLIHPTEVSNLDVICAGAIPDTPSELVSSVRMKQLLDEVRKTYDRVFIDCPPVTAVSDPLMIASASDGVIYTTKFNKIRRDHARRAIQRIHEAGIYVIGLILNDIDFEGKDSYYYSYYYYQNRYYAAYKNEPASRG